MAFLKAADLEEQKHTVKAEAGEAVLPQPPSPGSQQEVHGALNKIGQPWTMSWII